MTILSELKNIYISLGGAAADVANLTTSAQVLAAILAKLGGSAAGSQTDAKLLNKIAEYADGLIKPTGTKLIQNNGDVDVAEYASAHVDVPQPSGTISITENGDVDVTNYSLANVNVETYESSVINLLQRNMSSFTIPSGTIQIGTCAFTRCDNLVSVYFPSPNTVQYILGEAFRECTSLANIDIPNGVVLIGANAFSGCLSLETATLPEGIEAIPRACFSACSNLHSVLVPSTVTAVGQEAFYGCHSLGDLSLPSGVTTIEQAAFQSSGIRTIYIPVTLTAVAYGVFLNCSNLTDIYYEGTQLQWRNINQIGAAQIPDTTTIHYKSWT